MTPDPSAFQLGEVGGAGPAVLCLHGLTGTPYEVRRPAEELTRHGFACLGLALPGHLETPGSLARTPRREWCEAVLVAYDELDRSHASVYVLGLSLGGLLALWLAAERRVAGLVVLAAPLKLRGSLPWVVPALSRLIQSVRKTPAIVDAAARERHPGYDRMPLAAVRELLHLQREVRRGLGRVAAPIRLLYSQKDPTVDPRDAARVQAAVSSAESSIRYLAESGHVITVDLEAEEVARDVAEFLTRIEADRSR